MQPEISIIIPVFNAESTIRECLDAVFRNQYTEKEVILVDDGSSDSTLNIAEEYMARIIRMDRNSGPSAARNRGATQAKGEILFFIDSDVIIGEKAFSIVAAAFSNPKVEAITGLFTDKQRYGNFSSEYKNLWMHYTYDRLDGEAALFYTSGAAIRKDVFLSAGKFDESYTRPSVEDTDFGHRLREAGHKVSVEKDLTVEHIKKYSLAGMLRTDFLRSSALVKLFLRRNLLWQKQNQSTSVPGSFVASVVLLFICLACLLFAGFLRSGIWALSSLLLYMCYIGLNRGFLSTLRRKKGWGFAVRAIPAMTVDTFVAGVGIMAGFVGYAMGDRY